MKKGYTGSKKLANWVGVFGILLIFTIDTLLGNVYKFIGSEDYVTQVYQYMCYKEIFNIVPYILLIIISKNIKVRFDAYDMAILFVCLLLQLLNCFDFFVNNNWRPMWCDWVLFFSVSIPAMFLKFLSYR